MGLVADIQAAVSQAFEALDDVPVAITYLSAATAGDVYDPIAETVTPSDTSISVNAILTNFSKEEIDGDNIRPFDRRVLIVASDLVDGLGNLVTPKVDDKMTFESKTWQVQNVGTDPTKSVWIVQARTGN